MLDVSEAWLLAILKGQLISKGLFDVFKSNNCIFSSEDDVQNLPKKQGNFCKDFCLSL